MSCWIALATTHKQAGRSAFRDSFESSTAAEQRQAQPPGHSATRGCPGGRDYDVVSGSGAGCKSRRTRLVGASLEAARLDSRASG